MTADLRNGIEVCVHNGVQIRGLALWDHLMHLRVNVWMFDLRIMILMGGVDASFVRRGRAALFFLVGNDWKRLIYTSLYI
jgi:hypothetical protein